MDFRNSCGLPSIKNSDLFKILKYLGLVDLKCVHIHIIARTRIVAIICGLWFTYLPRPIFFTA
ncbi:hypothetical protein BpHYR1_047231 [Brachionus plicatilis]|uniref:Uncharacterized protein n=1 Tax=Brachionus plicatilis TaxID=10195 RepID=A0A3M7T575_BRAPC|nr:hypothetical protein BpHYR1_047231 [Brachionus plicatilis]